MQEPQEIKDRVIQGAGSHAGGLGPERVQGMGTPSSGLGGWVDQEGYLTSQPWRGTGDAHLAPWGVRGPGKQREVSALRAAAASSPVGSERKRKEVLFPVDSWGWILAPTTSQDRHPWQAQTQYPWDQGCAATGTDSPLQERPHCTGPA